MNTFAKRVAAIFAVFYLLCVCIALLPLENISSSCYIYAPGPAADGSREVQITAEGATERHLVDKDEACIFFSRDVVNVMSGIGLWMAIFFIGCFEGNGCDSLTLYGLGGLAVLITTAVYWLVGFAVGSFISKLNKMLFRNSASR